MSREFGSYAPVLLPVLAEETAGKNSIPRAMAEVLAHLLKWNIEERVFQANVVGHTGASGFARLASQAIFKGSVESGLHYVLIDDFIGQGGTLANLRGHILAQGCDVLGASVLTGKSSLNAWTKLVEEGKVEPLVVQLDSLPELKGKVRMLSQTEQEQLLAGNEMIGDYVRRILNTVPPQLNDKNT